MDAACRIGLMGGLRVEQAGRTITRFRTYKTGALLAYLAFYGDKPHPRETLTELLWPECDPDAGRNSLSKSLGSLRNQLEPPGVPVGAVIIADRTAIRLNPLTCTTDSAAFLAAIQASHSSRLAPAETTETLTRAVDLYGGELLPALYEDWNIAERGRLAELYLDALLRLSGLLERDGDLPRAREFTRRAITAEPFHEETQRRCIVLALTAGDPASAVRQYRDWERLCRKELGADPAPDLRALVARYLESDPGPDLLPAAPRPREAVAVPRPPVEAPPHAAVTRLVRDAAGAEAEAAVRRNGGVSRPERSDSVPPIPAPASVAKTNLPFQLTRFFGREDDLARLLSHVALARQGGARLWTLTGPGGIGKTRCSLEVARQSLDAYSGAVCFVPLAEVRDSGLVINAIGEALHLRPAPALDPFAQVLQELAGRPTLLVLDNFEQLVGPAMPDLEAAEVVGRLLQHAPALTCLVTSRHRLGVAGEREFPLSPLPVPGGGASPTALAECESVRLFVDRAQAVRPDFQITPGNAAAVAALCERLEGLPLAIELAAARAQVLTPAQMLKQLERRFDFLVSRQRNFALRHRTIRAAIDWSYGLLTPDLRRFAGLLSVFHGGWNLAAAEAVTGEPLALDFLEQLVDCSLALADADGPSGEMRYRQLETLRQYADEMLTAGERDALKSRHVAHFLTLAEEAEQNLQGPQQGEWLARLEMDHDNLRAAFQWCLQLPGHVEHGLRMARALWRFWHVRGHITEGRERLAELMEAAEADGLAGSVFGQAQVAAGILARYQNDTDVARALLTAGIESALTRRDSASVALAQYHLALVEVSQNHWADARALLGASLNLCRAHGDRAGVAAALSSLAIVESEAGAFDRAEALFTEALALRRALGDDQGIATLLCNLGNVALLQTDHDQARALFEESLTLRRALGDRWGIASLLNSLGLLLSNQKEYRAARPHLEESLGLFRDLGDKSGAAIALCNLGTVALMMRDPLARALLVESLTLRWQIGDKLGVAFALEALAQLEVASGDTPRAVTLWAVTESLRREIGAPLPPANRVTVERAVTAAREAMAADVFTAAWAHGEGLELAQALSLMLRGDTRPLPGK